MAKKSKSALLPLLAFAVLAVLGGLVVQKVKTGRAAVSGNVASPLDDKAKEWIEEVVTTPRPPATELP
ncbi:hypothetical protein G9E11_15185 [Arthrobacter sp. IA7]|uniref:hypothetical protein n=1 Tax=Arthrobacter ipis TaxID=2716202 RepID=UPI001684080D|nr:hypothetical protein [Arthrobacter ipis]MBD1543555.1 hypothetical protein [Arthrobacter ipis]